MKNIAIIDYFAGNIFSVAKAFEYHGCTVSMIGDRACLEDADALVLPGVGAFGAGMARLNELGVVQDINDFVATGKPVLGICLGMQLFFSQSHEFGVHEGLNLIPGQVVRLPENSSKVPHIGWNRIEPVKGGGVWKGTFLDVMPEDKDLYFVHSYACYPEKKEHWLAQTTLGGHQFCSACMKDNIFGTQFHPEKSGKVGLSIIERFLAYGVDES